MSGPADVVAEVLAPLVEQAGCELVDVTWAPGLLRISVDREGGIDLTTISDLSPLISEALDAVEPDPLPGRYTLEVSSPGLERPLNRPAHFRRFVGTKVAVKLTAEAADGGDRRLVGLLEAADDDGVVVAGRRFAHAQLEQAHTVFEWGPTPKKGGSKKPRPTPDKKAKV